MLESWLSECFAFVKWNCSLSFVFKVFFGVRQGSVLSPLLFAVHIGDIGKLSNAMVNAHVILYADDILLITPSVPALQSLLLACEKELEIHDQ